MADNIEEILQAFAQLKEELNVRDYDDELFLKDLPENEPISLVIPFERDARGYLDIFRSYIGGDGYPELSDEEMLKKYLLSDECTESSIYAYAVSYEKTFFRGHLTESESSGSNKHSHIQDKQIKKDYPNYHDLTRSEQYTFRAEYNKKYWESYTPKIILDKTEQASLIKNLNVKGLSTFNNLDEEAADTSSFVVLQNGIITPFMSKEEIAKILPQIKKSMSLVGMTVGGHIAPIAFEQMRKPAERELHEDFKNMRFNQFNEKYNSEKINSFYDLYKSLEVSNAENYIPSLVNSNTQSLWRGGILGNKPFIANINFDKIVPHRLRKSFGMATKDPEYAMEYATSGSPLDARNSKNLVNYGFLYQYKANGHETYFPDRGIERTPTTWVQKKTNKELETALFPDQHEIENIYILINDLNKGENLLYLLDINNPMHKDFLELHDPKDTHIDGYLKDRRINQFAEAENNGGKPIAHKIELTENNGSARINDLKSRIENMGQDEKPPFRPLGTDKIVDKSSLKFDAVAYKKMQEKQNT